MFMFGLLASITALLTKTSVSRPCFDLRHPYLVVEQLGGSPDNTLRVNKCHVQKLAAPNSFLGQLRVPWHPR